MTINDKILAENAEAMFGYLAHYGTDRMLPYCTNDDGEKPDPCYVDIIKKGEVPCDDPHKRLFRMTKRCHLVNGGDLGTVTYTIQIDVQSKQKE